MTELYARPEHEVIWELIPQIRERHLAADEARAVIAAADGLIPVGIDPRGEGRVMWADVGDHPFREWQFLYTIQHLAKEGAITTAFTTELDVLLDPAIAERGLAPRGFIFHVSRCGSTLLAKALARLDENIVINQGGPLQHGFWSLITGNWSKPLEASQRNLTLFRQLVLAMTRRRRPQQRNAFVKFISWNSLYMDFISQAFPGTPQVFLYRDAAEVIASVRNNTTAALEAKGSAKGVFLAGQDQTVDDVTYLARCYAAYFRTALACGMAGPVLINYNQISADTGADIMRKGLGYAPAPPQLEAMLQQFSLYSKDDTNRKEFTSDAQEKRQAISGHERAVIDDTCRALMLELDLSPRNLFAPAGSAVARRLIK